MEMLMAIFGVFALASLVALVKFQGNPLFVFALLLSLASLVWLEMMRREGAAPAARGKRRGRRK